MCGAPLSRTAVPKRIRLPFEKRTSQCDRGRAASRVRVGPLEAAANQPHLHGTATLRLPRTCLPNNMTAMEGKTCAKPPEKIKLREINPHLTCSLCKGYLINATTISECLHSFCRSCIIKFLQEHSYCPICELIINKAKPNLKLDKTLQDIVYKLVPELFLKEMSRRRQFYKQYPEVAAKVSPEERGEDIERTIFNPQDCISLSMEYISDDSAPDAIRIPLAQIDLNDGKTEDSPMKRYLQCPGMCRIEVLKKFVRNKYNVDTNKFHIDVLYKRIPLPDHYTLIDIAYIYSWKRNEPMKFFFRITDVNEVTDRFDHFKMEPPEEEVKVRVQKKKKKVKVKPEPVEKPEVKSDSVLAQSPVYSIRNSEEVIKVQKVNNKQGLPIGLNIIKQTVKKCKRSPGTSLPPVKKSEGNGLSPQKIVDLLKSDNRLDDEKSKFLKNYELTSKSVLEEVSRGVKRALALSPETKEVKKVKVDKVDSGLQSLIDNCKISIPSSLSITIKDNNEEKKPIAEPVQNFIEILKIPEKEAEDSEAKVDEDICEIAKSLTEKSTDKFLVPKVPVRIEDKGKANQNQSQSFQKIFEDSIKKPEVKKVEKRNIGEIADELFKKTTEAVGKVAIPRLPNQRALKAPQKKMNLHSNALGMNYSVSIAGASPQKSEPTEVVRVGTPRPNHSPKSSPIVKHMYAPMLLPPLDRKFKPVEKKKEDEKEGLNSNQLLEKYNIQNLAQLTASLSFNGSFPASQNQLAALQHAMLMKHLKRIENQSWPILHYEKYLQSLSSNQKILGNLKEN